MGMISGVPVMGYPELRSAGGESGGRNDGTQAQLQSEQRNVDPQTHTTRCAKML